MAEIEAAWVQPQAEWARRRLLVVRLIGQHELMVAQIMRAADGSRQTVFTYRDKVVAEGVAGLLTRACRRCAARSPTGSIPPCATSKTTSPPRRAPGASPPRSPASSTAGSPTKQTLARQLKV